MVSCEYCSKVEALPYQCVLCSKHFCSSHKDPQAHQCVEYTGSSEQGALSGIEQETKPSHEGLPYFIHAHTNVSYFAGHQGHTVIAVQLKKFGWNLGLRKRKGKVKDILASRHDERWYIRIKTTDARLSDVLRNIPISEDELKELTMISEREDALAVMGIVASDSAVLLSAKTFTALSP